MRFGKESIKWALIVSEHIGAEEIGDELDHVYVQASKADEYEAKAKAYDDIRYAMEMQTAIGVSDEDTLIDIDYVITRLTERMEGGEYDD